MDITVRFVLPAPHSIPEQRFGGCDLFTLPTVGDTLRPMVTPVDKSERSVLHVTSRRFSYGVDEIVIEIFAGEAAV